MHTLGIVGGIAPESTVDYYRQIIARYRERRPDGHYPAIVIDSIDLRQMLDLVAAGARPALVHDRSTGVEHPASGLRRSSTDVANSVDQHRRSDCAGR